MEIDTLGDIFINKLSQQGDGIIKHNYNGKIERIPFNNSLTQVLSSTGVWKEISTFTGLEVNNNNIIQTTTGNFGIGTNIPQAKLDVAGDAKVNGNFSATSINSNNITAGTINASNFTVNNTLNVHKIQAYRITCAPGDTVIRFGDSTLLFHPTNNNIYVDNTTTLTNKAVGIGSTAYGIAPKSFAAGSYVSTNGIQSIALGVMATTTDLATNAVVIGCGAGTSDLLTNYMDHTLMVGFNSNIPTLFVSKAGGLNKIGKVGIGTTAPETGLHINGEGDQGITITTSSRASKTGLFSVSSGLKVETQLQYNGRFSLVSLGTPNIFRMTVDENGVVYIGKPLTSNPNAYNLAVNGIIGAQEIFVEVNGWPDYVYKSTYKLKPLAEIEAFVKTNKHLPGFENAAYYEKNNLPLGDIVKLQQEKIEELTLYLIQIEKEITELKKNSK